MKSNHLTMRWMPLLVLFSITLAGSAGAVFAEARVLQDHAGSVMSLSFSSDQATLVTSSRDGTIKIWNVASGKLERTLTAHNDDVYCVTYSPDGNMLASSSGDKSIRLWDARTFEVVRVLNGHTDAVRWVAFSPDGKTLASVGSDHTIRLWDVATGAEKKSFTGHDGVVKMVRFSPDGETLVTCASDTTVRTWDTESGRETAVLAGHTNSVEGVALSSDGTRYASSSNDATVRIWDATTGQPVNIFLGHVGEVDSVTISPDNKTVISGSKDKTIRLWDMQSGQLLATLTGHTGRIESLEISEDGKMLATGGGGGDTSVRIWVLPAIDESARTASATEAAARTAITRDIVVAMPLRPTAAVDPLWRLIGNDDGDDTGLAVRGLIAMGNQAVAPLAARLGPPTESPTPERIQKLIAELDSPDPRVRERITCDLIQIGEATAEPIRQTLKRGGLPLVVQHRLEMVLHDVSTKAPGEKFSAAQIERESNAVMALRSIATPAAKDELVTLSKGDPESELTKQAKAALRGNVDSGK